MKHQISLTLVAITAYAQTYTYGDSCHGLQDQDCSLDSSCTQCSWSWPSNDSAQWASPDAKCRCASSSSDNSSDDQYEWSTTKARVNTWGDCKLVEDCQECYKSWPINDPAGNRSANAKYRCKSSSDNSDDSSNDKVYEYSWGDKCSTNQDDDCSKVSGCNNCKWSWNFQEPEGWNGDSAMCRC